MSSPLLSIVIPTYNRRTALTHLLTDLALVLKRHAENVQIVVCDNASTDGTLALVDRFAAEWPGVTKLVLREVNFGMEGNIACAMVEGDGKYIWMLSDHQRICIENVINMIDRLSELDFDVGHAKLVQWSAILSQKNKVTRWSDITPQQRGALLFSLGNLSTMILKRELVLGAMKAIFRACFWSYPHLGIISRLEMNSRLIEFDNLSALPEGNMGSKLKHDYDKILVRFHSNIECVSQIIDAAGLQFDRKSFFTSDYRKAFRGEIMNLLRQDKMTRFKTWKTLKPVIAANPFPLKIIALFVLVVILIMPVTIRTRLSNKARDILLRNRSLVQREDDF